MFYGTVSVYVPCHDYVMFFPANLVPRGLGEEGVSFVCFFFELPFLKLFLCFQRTERLVSTISVTKPYKKFTLS